MRDKKGKNDKGKLDESGKKNNMKTNGVAENPPPSTTFGKHHHHRSFFSPLTQHHRTSNIITIRTAEPTTTFGTHHSHHSHHHPNLPPTRNHHPTLLKHTTAPSTNTIRNPNATITETNTNQDPSSSQPPFFSLSLFSQTEPLQPNPTPLNHQRQPLPIIFATSKHHSNRATTGTLISFLHHNHRISNPITTATLPSFTLF
ncbi:hypothetical protein PIB30_083791 [Stylosanthes scabra]|uniref:Uncharacterized protein n=1 Tax=Stylosanthes scabra TaxID=79078 RepID=A0ABU6XSX9_9FABA|nr:hypothetical protein [Stylosanthes scabra]